MAILSLTAPSLIDVATRLDPDGGKIATIAELLSLDNAIMEDMMWEEGNLPTGHRLTVRTGLPEVYWRSLNQGVPSSKSATAQVDEATGMLEAYSRVDVDLAGLNGNSEEFRLSEDVAFIEAMTQQQATTMFYGNPGVDPRQYLGLAPRYSSLSAGNGSNIIDAGGTASNNTSIWIVCWGPGKVFGIYPKGTMAGLQVKDDGELTVYDTNNNPYKALQTHYSWKNGLAVKDWRYVVRIANINTANLVAGTAAADIVALLSRAMDRLPGRSMGKTCIYMNRTVHSMLKLQALQRSNNVLTIEKGLNQFGAANSWTSFDGAPLRRVDAILNTEARVV